MTALRSLITSCLLNTWLLTGADAQTAPTVFEAAKKLWQQADYSEAHSVLTELRETNFGRSFEVDFMLGTSACRLPHLRERGAKFLGWVYYTYFDKLTPEGRDIVWSELNNCTSNAPLSERQSLPLAVSSTATAMARYSGKRFYFGDRTLPVIAYPEKKTPIPLSTIRQRNTPLGEPQTAVRRARETAPKSRIVISKRFVIASQSNHSESQLRSINAALEHVMDFYVQKFKMREPERFIFVFLVPSMNDFQRFASRYHGLTLDGQTIAYSSTEDLSIVAIIPRLVYGSLTHELFHLLVRSNFGDIPSWLDEGLAALYESTRDTQNEIKGIANWRGDVLRNHGALPPSDLIRQLDIGLVSKESNPFDDKFYTMIGTLDAVTQARFAASARYFALYLQDKGLLAETYLAVRDLASKESFSGEVDDVVATVEKATGLSFNDLDKEFERWLNTVNRSPPKARFD